MLLKAIEKIKSEMEKNKASYVQVVGNFLLKHLEANPGSAERILAEDKTIAKSLDEMRKAAEKQKVGNCAVLTDEEGFAVVLQYFGIEGASGTQAPAAPGDFDVKLEDLLKKE